jgi:DNA-directed RNA polymerase specialized sigma24 family protein
VIEAASSGDREALDQLAGCVDRFVRIFRGSLSAHLRRTQGSTVDFVLEGLAQALADLKKFRYESDEQFYAWVTRTIQSRIVDAWRREARKKRSGRPRSLDEAGAGVPSRDPSASQVVAEEELRAEVGKAVLEVQIEHSQEMEVVVLKLFEGESWAGIKDILELASERRARTLFARGLDLLRPRVKRALGGGSAGEPLGT